MQNLPARQPASWLVLTIAIVALVAATVALTASLVRPAAVPGGMMGGAYGQGMMGGGYGPGMMGRSVAAPSQPGDPGFVAGTAASPRVIRVTAGPGYRFSPPMISVARGETVTFLVTTMGPTIHEFLVGPAEAVAVDQAGTPEIADIAMMQTKSLTFTFDGPGPYAFACHVEGHYEAGMRGTITLVG